MFWRLDVPIFSKVDSNLLKEHIKDQRYQRADLLWGLTK